MMDILIVLEDNNGKIHRMGLESIAAGQRLSNEMGLTAGALVLGGNADGLADQASAYQLGEVLKVNDALLESYSADGYSEAVKQIIDQENPTYVLFGHTYQVRDYVPRLSAKMNKPFLVDNIAIRVENGQPIFTKQMFNAKLSADVEANSSGPFLVSFQSAADRKSTRLNSSHALISYAVFCLKKKKNRKI